MALIDPNLWNSIHRPVIYRYTFTSWAFAVVNDDGTGQAEVVVGLAWVLFQAGSQVYIPSGIYAGNWVIESTDTNVIVLNRSYIGTDSGTVRQITTMSAELWAGYQSTHEGYVDHPWRKIADFTGVPNMDGEIEMDVSGYLRSMFKEIQPPRMGHDFTMSVPFRLVAEDPITGSPLPQTDRYGLNGTFDQVALQSYDDYHKVLNAREPIHFVDGVCVYSMIWQDTTQHGEHIFNVLGINGDGSPGGLGFDAIGTTFTVG